MLNASGHKGDELVDYVSKLGWTVDASVVSIPPNPDNQVEASVVRENIQLPRECTTFQAATFFLIYVAELSKIISHAAKAH